MEKLKVLFFSDMLIPDLDGANRTIFHLINRIPSDQFEFLFICGIGNEHITEFECIHVTSLKIPGSKIYHIAIPLFQKFELDEKINRFNPDVIHLTSPSFLGNYGLLTAKRLKIPVISIYHTHFISYFDYYFKFIPLLVNITKRIAKSALLKFYNRCDLVYVPCRTIIKELTEIGIRPEVLKLWQRGIDHSLFSPAKKNPELLQSITGNDNPCILFASRLVWEKNLQTLVDLYCLIKEKQLNYNLIVAGEGNASEALQKLIPEAYFVGMVGQDKLAQLYASARVFFFPSVTETFGNVVLEAMASGTPCVIANGGGCIDSIRHGKNGFLCEATNAQDFLNHITQIIDQPELALKFSKRGLETSEKYIWETLALKYFADLKSITLKASKV